MLGTILNEVLNWNNGKGLLAGIAVGATDLTQQADFVTAITSRGSLLEALGVAILGGGLVWLWPNKRPGG
jgi:hypothetical protein